ncbi:MAG: transcriptional repressor LexA [Armatimonadetes bacterium]|nr:transcriptional repressor LexA [Armatimonadota bacterium]
MKGLTKRQREVYDFILSYIENTQRPPTIREIGEHFGMKSTGTVRDNVLALEKKGYIRQRPRSARGIELVQREDSRVASGARRIPIVGSIAAGQPLLAVENIEDQIDVDARFFGESDTVFALRVKGDSMRDAGIYDGDYVFVRRQETAENGDIVAAVIGDEATVKRYFHEGNRIRLQPANESMAPIYVDANQAQVILAGKVIGVLRELQ